MSGFHVSLHPALIDKEEVLDQGLDLGRDHNILAAKDREPGLSFQPNVSTDSGSRPYHWSGSDYCCAYFCGLVNAKIRTTSDS